MRDQTRRAIETCLDEGASYADIRIVTLRGEDISFKKGNIEVMNLNEVKGFGIRVIKNGGWGFAGSYDVSLEEIERVAKLATRIANASGGTRKEPITMVEEKAVEDTYETKVKKDPFKIPSEEKIEILREADKRLMEYDSSTIKMTSADFRGNEEQKVFASSEGAYINQRIVWCGGGISCTAMVAGNQPQRRSYPGSFRGDFATSGYEYFEGLKILD
ncbi:MAG: PmbA/TldA family metallopeptidase, partial [Candidatus Thorarchaeota archaeon]